VNLQLPTAVWIPGWYELDQAIEIGQTDEFVFWRDRFHRVRDTEQWVFYNTLWHPEDAIVATGSIATIRHDELGDIRKVDTRGLDYTFMLADGAELCVNAEEEPGQIYEQVDGQWKPSPRSVAAWEVIVEFDSLSEPLPAPLRIKSRD
jgi:hypothetical protein